MRTLQASAAFAELTALENLIVGAGLRRVHGGALRTAFATPLARAEDAATRADARSPRSRTSGSPGRPTYVPASLQAPSSACSPSRRRSRRGRACFCSTSPPPARRSPTSAGSTRCSSRLRARGVAVLLVEHNLRLVRAVADRVIVMAAGAVIAAGSPAAVAADPEVRAAYLGQGRAVRRAPLAAPARRSSCSPAAAAAQEDRRESCSSPSTRRSRAARTSGRRSRAASSSPRARSTSPASPTNDGTYKLKVKRYDNALSPRKALANIRRAIADGAVAIIDDGTGVDAVVEDRARRARSRSASRTTAAAGSSTSSSARTSSGSRRRIAASRSVSPSTRSRRD